jgi:predicted transcriptional regulator
MTTRATVRMDARLDSMTRAKLEELATRFRRSRAAVLREVMQWGLRRGPVARSERDDPHGPFQSLFFEVEAELHQQVGEAAKASGMGIAPWLRHLLREITMADFSPSWQAAAEGTPTPQTMPRVSQRSHDSRTYDQRFMLRLNRATGGKLQDLIERFRTSKAPVIRQLIAQARSEDFPHSWRMAVDEQRQRKTRPGHGA